MCRRWLPLLVACCLWSEAVAVTQVLRWADEFVPCQGGSCINGGIDTTRWGFELGDGTGYGDFLSGWGNAELQCYTRSAANAAVVAKKGNKADGYLAIKARYHRGGASCFNGRGANTTRFWSSARLTTQNKASFKWTGVPGASNPIRIDVRVNVPMQQGTWPAAWMLPQDSRPYCMACSQYGDGWCVGGEIDIMEHVNADPQLTSNLHWGGLPEAAYLDCKHRPGNIQLNTSAAPGRPASVPAAWHVVSMVWDSTYIRFYVDNVMYNTYTVGDWYSGTARDNKYAPFDQPFYMILNMAVGGNYPGFNMDSCKAPYSYLVDYVRVWDLTCDPKVTRETNCSDGLDDDCDGLVDMQDPDCAAATGGR